MKRKAKPKAIPLGPPLATPDDQLDLLALVTPEDIADAQASGRQRMTPRGIALMDTERTLTDDTIPLGTN